MKNITIIILVIFSIGQTFGQNDKNGNPVFNSVTINEKSIGDFLLISNYYTLKNNIENPLSSVFISEKPTLDQVEKAAGNLPSDFFIITKESKIVVMIMLQNNPKREFMIIDVSTNETSTAPCNLQGDLTQKRVTEILKEGYDTTSKIENSVLTFNGKSFSIVPDTAIEESVLELIKREKLDKKKPSGIKLLSKNEIKEYILTETKEGGKLDFFTEIKGHEMDGIQIKPGVYSTKISMALYKWGRACFDLGVNTIEDAFEIYGEFKGRQLNQRETDYIKKGFNKDLEK